MAFVIETISGSFWPNGEIHEGRTTQCGIKNDGNVPVVISYLYIRNLISNPQEDDNYYNFVFSFKYNPSEILSWNSSAFFGAASTKAIPYPSHYTYKPGNQSYFNIGVAGFRKNYNFPTQFIIPEGDTFFFPILFTPFNRRVDFYRAELVVGYTFSSIGESGELTNPIHGIYDYTTSDIDHQESQTIMSISGVPFGGLLTIQ